jgi:Uma2 family endonuclease
MEAKALRREEAMSPAPRLTVEEYLRTPETVIPQELIYGALRVADAPTPRHQATLFQFALRLHEHVSASDLGRIWLAPVDVFLDVPRALVVQPDLIFVSSARLSIVKDRVWGAPDMVLEVMSSRPRIGRLDERLGWFGQYGVRECWLIYELVPRVEILSFREGRVARRRHFSPDDPLRSTVLPGFNLSFASIAGI